MACMWAHKKKERERERRPPHAYQFTPAATYAPPGDSRWTSINYVRSCGENPIAYFTTEQQSRDTQAPPPRPHLSEGWRRRREARGLIKEGRWRRREQGRLFGFGSEDEPARWWERLPWPKTTIRAALLFSLSLPSSGAGEGGGAVGARVCPRLHQGIRENATTSWLINIIHTVDTNNSGSGGSIQSDAAVFWEVMLDQFTDIKS